MSTMTTNALTIFESGETFADFRARVLGGEEQAAKELAANEALLKKTNLDLAAFDALPFTVRVLVLEEDWCGDCLQHLPILDRIARDTGKLHVRIVSRDAHLDLQDRYLKYGKQRAIPLVLFLDADGNVGGQFIERPESVTERRAQQRAGIHARHPEFGGPGGEASLSDELHQQLNDLVGKTREEMRPFAIEEAVREFGEQATLASA